jgi:hypothetical protein
MSSGNIHSCGCGTSSFPRAIGSALRFNELSNANMITQTPNRELRPICPACCGVHRIKVPPAARISVREINCLQCGKPFQTELPRSGKWEMTASGQLLFGR